MRELETLSVIAEAKYEQLRQKFSLILAEETELRAELSRINGLSASTPSTGLSEMQAIGADIIWQGWLTRSKMSLNLELAQVLARKAQEQDRIRQAFGKLNALNTLIGQQHRERKKQRDKTQLSDALMFRSDGYLTDQ